MVSSAVIRVLILLSIASTVVSQDLNLAYIKKTLSGRTYQLIGDATPVVTSYQLITFLPPNAVLIVDSTQNGFSADPTKFETQGYSTTTGQ